jgi:hypothetical protein
MKSLAFRDRLLRSVRFYHVDGPPVIDIVFIFISALFAKFVKMHSPGLVAPLTIIFENEIYLKFGINS